MGRLAKARVSALCVATPSNWPDGWQRWPQGPPQRRCDHRTVGLPRYIAGVTSTLLIAYAVVLNDPKRTEPSALVPRPWEVLPERELRKLKKELKQWGKGLADRRCRGRCHPRRGVPVDSRSGDGLRNPAVALCHRRVPHSTGSPRTGTPPPSAAPRSPAPAAGSASGSCSPAASVRDPPAGRPPQPRRGALTCATSSGGPRSPSRPLDRHSGLMATRNAHHVIPELTGGA